MSVVFVCDRCGKISGKDCVKIDVYTKHINNTHDFRKGYELCEECMKDVTKCIANKKEKGKANCEN